ncbi:MAG: hypothetical protein EOR30_17110 [Mesorhizobium sp.]|uniref:hypothetical protein n=1 Tax=unclassified Mesorhizobium TaxID=325217 RepID=UPI000FCBD716|nr:MULTISPECIES: hypothetical protein [unclassified Mesorhizobium]RUV75914.1 hypothetical protein EOA78_04745 [Mesorhizobium sp. M5C.F.Cr.IN.023.01.1.1]RWF80281.1 MAG: hypothetical protein EOQ36_32910 [Mesorhizobium sp.]RWF95297.1 MAG: hypothetical protein EOQ45_08175 [Mesorhizobium sp.]RWI39869.1 MAG: hypothetical protein EOR14_17475 [Mesorhizobium sp.]RWI45266.1 MAG: hypothetical protein EOR15_22565 [Mesorhizobium sp.]
MATLIVTFSKIDGSHHYVAPVAQGANCRTETITMPATGALSAAATEEIVELLADADCWVAISSDPDSTIATDGTGTARKIKANIPYTFGIRDGEKVAVEAA